MAPGTRITDRYVVTGEIGAGGMGVVVSARDEKLGRVVAIKVLSQATIGDESARRRLIREARAAASLDHPSIVHVYDVGETDDGSAFFVMELVKGTSLGQLIKNGTASKRRLLKAIVEVGRALAYAHGEGFVHRDIKPDNIMLRSDRTAVVLDFGLAKSFATGLAATAQADSVTSQGGFVGTPAFVSPEQARGEPIDPATDQFSLAVTAFEAMTGEIPWHGKSALEVVSEILKGAPRKLTSVAPDLPKSLEIVLERAMEKDKSARFASIAAFAEGLEACIADLPEGAASTDASSSVPAIHSAKSVPVIPSSKDAQASPIATTAGEPETKQRSENEKQNDAIQSTKVSHGLVTKPAKSRPIALYAVAGLVLLGAITIFSQRLAHTDSGAASSASANALSVGAPRSGIVACPLFDVSGDEEKPSAWLGAAAASLACQRVQIMLGGRASTTLAPAELLRLPREPKDGSKLDAFEVEGASDRSIAYAKERADLLLKGSVERSGDIRITLRLEEKNGTVLATGEGAHRSLLGAVRIATDAIRARGFFRAADTQFLSASMPGASVDGALAMQDLTVFVLDEDDTDVKTDCDAIKARSDLGEMALLVRATCEHGAPLDARKGADETAPVEQSISAAVVHLQKSPPDSETAAQHARVTTLEAAASKESDADMRALLYASAADATYYLGDSQNAARLARLSIQASPKSSDLRGTPWHRLSFTSLDLGPSILVSHASWLPWEPFAQANEFMQLGSKPEHGIGLHRAYVLARSGYWAKQYGEWLLRSGRIEEGRGIVAEMNDPYLFALGTYVEGFPGKTLETAKGTLAHMTPGVTNGAQATRLAAFAVALAIDIGKSTDFASDFVERFLDPKAPGVSHGAAALNHLLGLCMRLEKPVAEKCVSRLRRMFDAGYFGAGLRGSDELVVGAEQYIGGHYDKAATAWRPVTGTAIYKTEGIREQLASTFERTGAPELAEKLDDEWLDDEALPDANPSHLRSALRLEQRGDTARAKLIAAAFVKHWTTADERPRGFDEMKRLLARLH